MSRYAKALVAFFGGMASWGATAAPEGYTQTELWGICAVIATALAVFAVPNDRPADEPYDPNISEREPADPADLGLPAAVGARRRVLVAQRNPLRRRN